MLVYQRVVAMTCSFRYHRYLSLLLEVVSRSGDECVVASIDQ